MKTAAPVKRANECTLTQLVKGASHGFQEGKRSGIGNT